MKIRLTKWCKLNNKNYRRALRDFAEGKLENATRDRYSRIWVEVSVVVLYVCGDFDLLDVQSQIEYDVFLVDQKDTSSLGKALATENLGELVVKGYDNLSEDETWLVKTFLETKGCKLTIL